MQSGRRDPEGHFIRNVELMHPPQHESLKFRQLTVELSC